MTRVAVHTLVPSGRPARLLVADMCAVQSLIRSSNTHSQIKITHAGLLVSVVWCGVEGWWKCNTSRWTVLIGLARYYGLSHG